MLEPVQIGYKSRHSTTASVPLHLTFVRASMPAGPQASRPPAHLCALAGVLPAAALGQGAGEALGRPPASVQQRATSGHRRVPFPEGGRLSFRLSSRSFEPLSYVSSIALSSSDG